jgi:hypothetical protein
MREWSLLIPCCINALIAGKRRTFATPHRLVVSAYTKSEARAQFKKALRARLPAGLTKRGDLLSGPGKEPSIFVAKEE